MKLSAVYLAVEDESPYKELVEYAVKKQIPIYAPLKLCKKLQKQKTLRHRVLPSIQTIQKISHLMDPILFLNSLLQGKAGHMVALLVEFPKKSLINFGADASLATILSQQHFAFINLIRYGIQQYPKLLLVSSPSQAPLVMSAFTKRDGLKTLRERLAWEAWERLKQYEGMDGNQEWSLHMPGDTVSLLGGDSVTGAVLVDLHLALEYLKELREPGAVLIGPAKECNIAEGASLKEAFCKAMSSQRYLFGRPKKQLNSKSLIAFNRPVDSELAQLLATNHFDTIVAPAYEIEALAFLRVVPTIMLLLRRSPPSFTWNWIYQDEELTKVKVDDRELIMSLGGSLKVVTRRFPHPNEWRDLLFSWKIIYKAPNTGVMVVKEQQIHGHGRGQINCLHDVTLALEQAAQAAQGATIAFRNFIPFKDGVELAGQFGIKAVIQPGGSVRDDEVIEMADHYDMAMVFAGGGLSRLGSAYHG